MPIQMAQKCLSLSLDNSTFRKGNMEENIFLYKNSDGLFHRYFLFISLGLAEQP